MADRIDIGMGPRLGFDPTDTGGFKYVSQKELTQKEYEGKVNFYNQYLGLPSLGEESGIEVGAPEIGEDIAPPTSEESPSESEMLTSMLQGPMVSLGGGDFEKGDPDIKFGKDLLDSSHQFDKYSDYVRKAPGLSDRVGLLEGIFEPLSTGKFKDLDFSVLGKEIKNEIKSGIQAVQDLPQTVLGAGEGDIKGKIEKGARKGFGAAFAVSGFPLAAIGSVLFSNQQTKNAFGETVPLASGPIGAATQLSLSRQYEIVNSNRAAIAAGATDQGFMIKLPNGQYILREAGKENYFDNTGLSFKQKQELDGLTKGFLPDTYRASGKPGFLDFTTGFSRLEKANVGVVESGGIFTDSANPLKGFYTADGKYYTPGVGYSRFASVANRNRLAQAQGISPERMQDLIEDARAGKGKLGDLIKAERATIEEQKFAKDLEEARKQEEQRKAEERRKAGAGLSYGSDEESSDPAGNVAVTEAGLGGYSAIDYGGIFAQGGTVGMAAGGAMAAGMGSGFVDRPPSQVPEEQTVADNVETQLPEGAFVINAAAVEFAGEQDIKKMLNDAQKEAVRRGITIDNSENSAKLIDVAISRGEVTVAPYLAKIIGYDRLNKINNRGKPETKERLQEAAQGGMLDMANGGTVTGPTPRPSRPDMSQLGDVEFRADLDVYLQNDPLARLGYNMYEAGELELESVVLPSEEQREIKLGIGGMYIPKESRKSPSRNERFFQEAVEIQQGPNSSDLEKHAVIAFTGKNVNLDRHMGALTMLHELRHAAITHLEEKYGIPRPPISSEETMMDIQDYMNRLDARKVKASIPKKSKSQFAEEKKEAAYKYDSGMKRQLENFQKLALGELKERGVPERQPSIPQEGFLTRTYKSLVN